MGREGEKEKEKRWARWKPTQLSHQNGKEKGV
jgi:hypothetical protein